MFHFGFSYVGLLYLIMLFVPNIIWSKHQPEGYEEYAKREKKILLALERIGEILVCGLVVIYSDYNIRNTYWALFLILSFACMILYEIYWVRYFKSQSTMKDMYRSILGIPVAGATLPVLAFGLLAIYGSNSFLLIATIILGIGHIGIHLQHRKEVWEKKKRKLPLRILTWIVTLIGVVVIGVIGFVIICRNMNYFNHYKMIQNGIDEGHYITIGEQEQYVLMRGMNKDNPVIVYLHGGPSSPDSYVTYGFSDYLVDDYTIIAWDQRGCGRTYIHNMDIDSNNNTASFEQALEDVNELVDYARKEFGQDKVILLGHSYGTLLGSVYAQEHPDKVQAYIGVAQVTSLIKTDMYSYEDALKKAKEAGDDTSSLEIAFDKYKSDESLVNLMELRNLVYEYHPVEISDKATWMAVTSPYFGIDDLRWFLKQLGNLSDYVKLNQQLFDYTQWFDIYNQYANYEMPVYFISGSCDWVCPNEPIREYMGNITAPDSCYEIIDGPGHNLQYSRPRKFAEIVKKVLER